MYRRIDNNSNQDVGCNMPLTTCLCNNRAPPLSPLQAPLTSPSPHALTPWTTTNLAMGPPFQPDHFGALSVPLWPMSNVAPAVHQHQQQPHRPSSTTSATGSGCLENYHNFLAPAMWLQIYNEVFRNYLEQLSTGNISSCCYNAAPAGGLGGCVSSSLCPPLNHYNWPPLMHLNHHHQTIHNHSIDPWSTTMLESSDQLKSSLRDECESRLQQLLNISSDSDDLIDVDVLMPNGTMITVNVAQNCTFSDIKDEVFELSQRGPMYGALHDQKLYSFCYVDEGGQQRDIDDEEIRLCDACPIGNLLKLVERQENMHDLEIDEQIGQLIGKSLKDFDALMNPEVNEFRYRMRSLCEDIVKTRQSNCWLDKMRYAFPTRVDLRSTVPKYLLDRLPGNGNITVDIVFHKPCRQTVQLAVNCKITADELIAKAMMAFINQLKPDQHYEASFLHGKGSGNVESNESFEDDDFGSSNDYLLKMNGTLEYLLDNHPLIQYKMIQERILANELPIQMLAIHRQSIEFEDEPIYTVAASHVINSPNSEQSTFRHRSQSVISLGSMASSSSSMTAKRRTQQVVVSSWSVDRKLLIKIHSAHINQLQFNGDITRVSVMVGIFHGGELLCEPQKTTSITLADLMKCSPQNPNLEFIDTITWEEDIVFNLKVSDLPRMARIAFTVVGYTGSNTSTKKVSHAKPIPVAWANINFFDYRGQLWESSTTLSMWLHDNENECVDDAQSVFNPLGTVVPNPNIDQTIFLTISFTKYSEGENNIIRFPHLTQILRQYPVNVSGTGVGTPTSSNHTAASLSMMGFSEEDCDYEATSNHDDKVIEKTNFKVDNGDLELIKKISQEDLLHRMEEKHRDLLWRLRFECCDRVPESLCKLLISFKWNNQRIIGEALSLLERWPKLTPDKALELLDYAYADSFVRKFAIECLKHLSNEDLSQYLLQLVQALKYESYIYNDLVQFLLERAFECQRIGHHLFWLLRSEMHNPAVSVTFGLILEAYCRGAIDHVQILSRQMEFLNKLKRINMIIRDDRSRENRDKKIASMQAILAQRFYQDRLTNVISPLNPVYKMGPLKVEKCKFMDSKMKPLWLVFENQDRSPKDIYIIYKNGDDLRQDMLTLQMIRIMDNLWKDAGYDFRMTPYRCISVEHCVGLIEVVLNADTIANIQKEKGAAPIAAFKKGSLLAWLKEHNPTEAELKRAIEEFTLSCAGYCVATYILGVADRHNDNIMVKRNGQLFHIDFGHILGKFKEKFGIRRERVPFVLTNDFVYVITHGHQSSCRDSDYFKRFERYCQEAFLIIRRRGSFLISLFAMMLSTGMPEISSVNDLQYLRETLVLDKSEDEARAHFNSKFNEALKNSWKTSINWCAHSWAKDNRMNDR